jgi:hypothetical protein
MYDISMLYSGPPDVNKYHKFLFPQKAMMDDLFQTIGVSQSQFFAGEGLWRQIPQVSGSPGEMLESAQASHAGE